MADSYVCSGATMRCTMGTSQAKLTVLPDRTVNLTGKPMANISDHKTMVNLGAFGRCRSMGFPATASATAAAQGTLTPMPCMHNTPFPWMGGKMDYIIKGQPALLKSCKCQCMWGGTISITDDGQHGEGTQWVQKKGREVFTKDEEENAFGGSTQKKSSTTPNTNEIKRIQNIREKKEREIEDLIQDFGNSEQTTHCGRFSEMAKIFIDKHAPQSQRDLKVIEMDESTKNNLLSLSEGEYIEFRQAVISMRKEFAKAVYKKWSGLDEKTLNSEINGIDCRNPIKLGIIPQRGCSPQRLYQHSIYKYIVGDDGIGVKTYTGRYMTLVKTTPKEKGQDDEFDLMIPGEGVISVPRVEQIYNMKTPRVCLITTASDEDDTWSHKLSGRIVPTIGGAQQLFFPELGWLSRKLRASKK